jgi:hypothetical protein
VTFFHRRSEAKRAQTRASPILACIDRSKYRSSVCDHAAWFASKLGETIELLYVRAPGDGEADAEGLEALGSACWRLQDVGAEPLELCSAEGDLPGVVQRLARRAELVVVGRRQAGSEADVGAVSAAVREVVAATSCAVCVVPKLFLPISRALVLADPDRPDPTFGARLATCPWLDGLTVSSLSCPTDRTVDCELLEIVSRRAEDAESAAWDLAVVSRRLLLARDDGRLVAKLGRAMLGARTPVLVL